MKCEECGAPARRVGTWTGIWIMACTGCPATWLYIQYPGECEDG